MIPLTLAVFPLAMAAAAWTDLRSMTIPNRLVLALAAVYAVYALAGGATMGVAAAHLLGGIVVLTATVACFAFGWMGGGDAKLIAATALWIGPGPDLLSYFVLASVYGGALTLALLAARRAFAPDTGHPSLDRLLDRGQGVPYGVALGAAGLHVFALAEWSMPLRQLLG